MKKTFLLLFFWLILSSHDMYLKLDSYFLAPNTQASIQLYNGTFERSDNVIARDRMVDVSLVGKGERRAVDTAQWSEVGETTVLDFTTGAAGTWVAGVSTRPRNIEMSAADFNDYLEHDGVLDMLEWRRQNDAVDQDAVEKYSKHVKTIFQVGETLSEDWQTVLGYPIEFVPLSNPYDLHPGHALQVELLWQGAPLANQLVYVGFTPTGHDHDHTGESADHEHDELIQLRTDANGMVSVDIDHQGVWYLRTIHLTESDEPGLTHESNWATLTFAIGEGHSHLHGESAEVHSHPEEGIFGLPGYVFWIGSVLLVGVLFLLFNRRTQ